ncbi:MAG: hypothetical protein SH857_13380 [Chitinophagales bacterium]|nr:hypothetical protein [Chitinophagales bacterium]
MKILNLAVLLVFPVAVFCQNLTPPDWREPQLNIYHSRYSAFHFHKINPTAHSFDNNSVSALSQNAPFIPVSTSPQRLPMFCALEKKLRETCNVWIKIRLPEHP